MRFLGGIENALRSAHRKLAPLLYAGTNRACPVCKGSFRRFRSAGRGAQKRPDARCPACGSKERDRLVVRFLEKPRNRFRFENLRLLHVAPERALVTRMRQIGTDLYVTVDLIRSDVDVRCDVASLPFANGTFDAVYCSHVLQDVPDDWAALREFARVLRSEGWAIVNVPVQGKVTIEHLDQPRRKRSFKDSRPSEHVRTYGTDYADRIREAGLTLYEITVASLIPESEWDRLSVRPQEAGTIYIAQKL